MGIIKKLNAQKRVKKNSRNILTEAEQEAFGNHFMTIVKMFWNIPEPESLNIELLQDLTYCCLLGWNIASAFPNLERAELSIRKLVNRFITDKESFITSAILLATKLKYQHFPNDRVMAVRAEVSPDDNGAPRIAVTFDMSTFNSTRGKRLLLLGEILETETTVKFFERASKNFGPLFDS